MFPLPWACIARTSCFMLRTTPRTLVSNVAAKLSAVWSVIGPTAPSVAALFTATSTRPNRATVLSTMLRTSSSLRTSALMKSASVPRAQFLNERLAGLITSTGNDHFHALLGEGDGGGAPDAGESTRNQNNWRIHDQLLV
jgi:hypothetical protein